MYVYLVEFYVVNSYDVRFDRGAEIYDSWDKADMAVNEFKEKHISLGCIFDYDSGYASDFRFVTLIDSGDDLKYHASFMRFEVK